MKELREQCEACKSKKLESFQISASPIEIDQLSEDKFQVTNKEYGSAIETVRCTACGLFQPRYLLDYRDIVKLYSNVHDEEYLLSAASRGESNYLQALKLIETNNSTAKKLLEIGAGSGTMLCHFKSKFEVEGIEPNKEFCEFSEQTYGVKIHNMGFEDFEGGKYDVIIALDVIEHVVSPDFFIKKVKNLLEEGGIAIIGTPDLESISHKILKKKWYHIRPPHLFYFSQLSFSKLIKQNGMKVVSVKNFVWNLSLNYLLDSVQQLLFKKSFIQIPGGAMKIKVNLHDSKVYVIKK